MDLNSFNIILPPVWSGVYVNTARLLQYALNDLGKEVYIVEAGMPEEGEISILLGWNLIPDTLVLKKPYILYQLEPLIHSMWREKMEQRKKLFMQAVAIWDYSEENKDFLIIHALQPEILAMAYHPRLEEVNYVPYPGYDILFVGFITERRQKILEKLQKHCSVSVQPRWGEDFTSALGRSKILLNIHQYDIPTPLEQPRISYALSNNTFCITETASDHPYQEIVSSEYDQLVNTTLHFLHNPLQRIEKKHLAYTRFKQQTMAKQLAAALIKLNENAEIMKHSEVVL